ncbi:hypothetical protein H0H92_006407 [Tricholoma furcatifolium]|nr:hypothetical protein H0H92_006407 [Tricholoma furcatifolium]
MARIHANPNEAVRPDFASDDYGTTREALVSADITEEVAITMLEKSWDAANAAEKIIWARQVQADGEEAEVVAQRARDLMNQEEIERRHDSEAANTEERKKNWVKYVELSEAPPPITPPEILLTYATTHLQKGQYVELWYFMNEGIAKGLKSTSTMDENTMTQSVDRDGTVTWIPAIAAKALHDTKADRDLSWE